MLFRNFTLESIVERYRQAARAAVAIMCGACKPPAHEATKSCMDCRASYCNECFKLHHPWGTPKAQHEYVGPTTNFRPKVPTLLSLASTPELTTILIIVFLADYFRFLKSPIFFPFFQNALFHILAKAVLQTTLPTVPPQLTLFPTLLMMHLVHKCYSVLKLDVTSGGFLCSGR